MAVERDFIKREIEKLVLVLTSLIDKMSGLKSGNTQNSMEEVNQTLKSAFDLTLEDFNEMDSQDFLKKIRNLHESHIEKLIELLYTMVQSAELTEVNRNYNKAMLSEKAVLLIDFLHANSTTFSVERMTIKNELQAYLEE